MEQKTLPLPPIKDEAEQRLKHAAYAFLIWRGVGEVLIYVYFVQHCSWLVSANHDSNNPCQGPVSQKSRNFSGLFWVPQFS